MHPTPAAEVLPPLSGPWVARDAPSRGCDPDLDRGGVDLEQGALMDNDGVAASQRPSGGLRGRAGATLPDLWRRALDQGGRPLG